MKKSLLSLILLCSLVYAKAQITVTGNNLLLPGTTVYQKLITANSLRNITLNTGANQTWNWSQLTDSTAIDTIEVVNVQNSPFAAYFPTANRAFKSTSNGFGGRLDIYIYLNFSAQGVSSVGSRLPVNYSFSGFNVQSLFVNRSINNEIARFPEQYQDDFSTPLNEIDSSFGKTFMGTTLVNQDNRYNTSTGNTRVEIVGWGNLVLPSRTIPALLKKTTETYKRRSYRYDFTSNRYNKTDSSDVLSVSYSWIANDAAYNIASVSMADGSTTRISRASYVSSSITTSLSRSMAAEPSVALYPMPAQDVLYIKLDKPLSNGTVVLQDLTGRTVASQPIDGIVGQLTLEGLVSGPYLARIQDAEGYYLTTKRITVVK